MPLLEASEELKQEIQQTYDDVLAHRWITPEAASPDARALMATYAKKHLEGNSESARDIWARVRQMVLDSKMPVEMALAAANVALLREMVFGTDNSEKSS